MRQFSAASGQQIPVLRTVGSEPWTHITLPVILVSVIQSFADRTTGELWRNLNSRKLDSRIVRPALRKLRQLNGAAVLDDLRVPPGNRLEALHGDRRGQHSIRVNSQWRICFTWTPAGPADVQIVDYH